jgi:hypothetical protein
MSRPGRQCLRTRALQATQRALPRVMLAIGDVLALIADTFALIARSLRRRMPGCSSPRRNPKAKAKAKPHPSLAYKG